MDEILNILSKVQHLPPLSDDTAIDWSVRNLVVMPFEDAWSLGIAAPDLTLPDPNTSGMPIPTLFPYEPHPLPQKLSVLIDGQLYLAVVELLAASLSIERISGNHLPGSLGK